MSSSLFSSLNPLFPSSQLPELTIDDVEREFNALESAKDKQRRVEESLIRRATALESSISSLAAIASVPIIPVAKNNSSSLVAMRSDSKKKKVSTSVSPSIEQTVKKVKKVKSDNKGDKKEYAKGTWTYEELKKLEDYTRDFSYGQISWVDIGRKIGRPSKECRGKYYRELDPTLKKTKFSLKEIREIETAVKTNDLIKPDGNIAFAELGRIVQRADHVLRYQILTCKDSGFLKRPFFLEIRKRYDENHKKIIEKQGLSIADVEQEE